MTVVTEAGLYSLILRSRKPIPFLVEMEVNDVGLTRKQMAFVAAFHGNAAEAARAAGYSAKTAKAIGSELLTKPDIKEAIQGREKERMNLMIASREERQRFWTQIMRDDEVDLRDRLRATELLGKSEGDFLEKMLDVTPIMPPAIQVVFVKADTALDS